MSNSRFKFRVWDKEEKRFADLEEMYLNLFDGEVYDNYPGWNDRLYKTDNRYQLVQSTGLYDCEGMVVWEGDIMDCPDAPRAPTGHISEAILEANPEMKQIEPSKYSLSLGVVIWNEGCASFAIKHIYLDQTQVIWKRMLKDFVAIGNKFENPELMEQELNR